MTTKHPTVSDVVKIAQGEVGYLEKKSNSSLNSKTANAGYANYTKYNRDMHKVQPSNMDFPAAWCDAFVDWCIWKACGKDLARAKRVLCGDLDDYTVRSADLYKKAGRWHTSPKKGDQVFFKNASGICHTGIVTKVTSSTVYTIEGNTSGASGVVANGGGVKAKSYSRKYSQIAGYGRPRYWEVASYKVNVTRYLYPEPKKQVDRRIAKVKTGTTVEYLGDKSGNWRRVKVGKREGWICVKSAGVSTVKANWKEC